MAWASTTDLGDHRLFLWLLRQAGARIVVDRVRREEIGPRYRGPCRPPRVVHGAVGVGDRGRVLTIEAVELIAPAGSRTRNDGAFR